MRAAVEEAAQVVCFEAAFALFVSLVLLQCCGLQRVVEGEFTVGERFRAL